VCSGFCRRTRSPHFFAALSNSRMHSTPQAVITARAWLGFLGLARAGLGLRAQACTSLFVYLFHTGKGGEPIGRKTKERRERASGRDLLYTCVHLINSQYYYFIRKLGRKEYYEPLEGCGKVKFTGVRLVYSTTNAVMKPK